MPLGLILRWGSGMDREEWSPSFPGRLSLNRASAALASLVVSSCQLTEPKESQDQLIKTVPPGLALLYSLKERSPDFQVFINIYSILASPSD